MELMDLLLLGALAAAAGMALLTVLCLFLCCGRGRKFLLVWSGIFLGTLALLTAGSWGLGWFGLAWRSGALYTLYLLLAGSGLGVLVRTVRCLRELLEERRALLRYAVLTAAGATCALIVATTVLLGPVLAVFSAWSDRTVVCEGQKTVEVNGSWLDPYFAYYDYHGPIVRGSQRLWSSTRPVR